MSGPIKAQDSYSLPYTIKAEWTAYVVFSIIFGLLTIFAAYVDFVKPNSDFWQEELIALLLLISFLVWIACFRITLERDKISYKTLFSRRKELSYTDIEKIEVHAGRSPSPSESAVGMFYLPAAFVRMDIFGKNSNLIAINMKPFSQRDLVIIVDAISNASPSTQLVGSVAKLKEGNFTPVVSETIKKFWQVAIGLFLVFLVIGFIEHFFK